MKTRVAARIVGRVQGVGFRPTVYRYATELGLAGFVRNDPQGVTLEVEGENDRVEQFFSELTLRPPQQAVIAGIEREELPTAGYGAFAVVESEPSGDLQLAIPPDLALCDDCRRELYDHADRRFEYPFINCVNCGPRFTIIRDLPYDRARTSMAEFTMCPACDHEYHEPRSRRFEAQPNACPKCGPRLVLQTAGGVGLGDRPVAAAQAVLQRGQIVAVKGLGGYHLACDAFSVETVARLRARKNRPGKAFAVMFRDLPALKRHCVVSEAEEAELWSAARPIVVLRRRAESRLARNISPDTDTLGAFLPYTPVHHLLLEAFEALVMTSANLSEEPIVSAEAELDRIFGGIADAALIHNREIVHKCDDSVLRVVNGQRQLLRRARGYVPNPVRIAANSPVVLATGGELKSAFCLVRDGQAYLSQHLGDLQEYRTWEHYRMEIAEWQRLLRAAPVAVAHDLHPEYLSTKYARSLGGATRAAPVGDVTLARRGGSRALQTIPVQHHHAHIVSVMAEHGLEEPVIGVALDGTGYGTDGTIWGGEFMVADREDFERVAHFKPYPLPGGDKAVREPWRMAASVLFAERLPVKHRGAAVIERMIEADFHSPLTSSAGRLFDAVGAILGLGNVAEYEAQVAIRLEAAANPAVTESYPVEFVTRRAPWVINFGPAVREIVAEHQAGLPTSTIAAKFHNTVAAAVLQVCRYLRGQRELNVVALSGGVFQNELLFRRTVELLQSRHFKVFTNTVAPVNDGGLALGQAAVAVARLESRSRRASRRAICA